MMTVYRTPTEDLEMRYIRSIESHWGNRRIRASTGSISTGTETMLRLQCKQTAKDPVSRCLIFNL